MLLVLLLVWFGMLLDLIGIDDAITVCFCWLDCAWTASVRLSKGVGTWLELKILKELVTYFDPTPMKKASGC